MSFVPLGNPWGAIEPGMTKACATRVGGTTTTTDAST